MHPTNGTAYLLEISTPVFQYAIGNWDWEMGSKQIHNTVGKRQKIVRVPRVTWYVINVSYSPRISSIRYLLSTPTRRYDYQ